MFTPVRLFLTVVGLIWLFGGNSTCAKHAMGDEQGKSRTSAKSIEAVLKDHTDQIMSLPGVVGTAIGECEGKPCIKVLIVKKTRELLNKIPSNLEGFRVVVEETGPIRALDPS